MNECRYIGKLADLLVATHLLTINTRIKSHRGSKSSQWVKGKLKFSAFFAKAQIQTMEGCCKFKKSTVCATKMYSHLFAFVWYESNYGGLIPFRPIVIFSYHLSFKKG